MKKSTMGLVLGSLVSAGGAAFAASAYKKRQKENCDVLEDTDMRNSEKIDQVESADADKVPEEKGLTQYDAALRSEWVANGYSQTHLDLEELEEVKRQKM
ncbi:hypothetical protein DFO73_101873 [Cytobacillus oceanisediminis]|jgi:hypothetical protein|uniref:Uncharacterized protein n=1 Tax=Cytobacillus oceanisediminis TaxID=665099 RepID=A0A2V3A7Q1_9BACI|nr:hypothetical protein [Cytobacillus oceanisediminis]PWW32608.1 hypothetical protein DFO73_101873 [Cytobacillus oceanisediminis]